MFNRTLFISALAFFSHAAAGSKSIDSESPPSCLWINPSAQPELSRKYHLVGTAEVLAWQAYENGLPIAIRTENPLLAPGEPQFGYYPYLRNGRVENLDFDWNAGFRLGLGDIWSSDRLDVSLTWLWFHSKGDRHLRAGSGEQLQAAQLHPIDGGEILPNQVPSFSPSFARTHAYWNAQLNQLDLDFGRSYLVANGVSVRPHVGLRTTWIQQRLAVNYDDNLVTTGVIAIPPSTSAQGDDYGVRKSTKWWGIGPEAGFEIRWNFPRGWSLFGDLAGSEELGQQQIGRKDFDATLTAASANSTLIALKDRFWMTRPILDLQLGLAWERPLKDHCYNLLIEAGWEQHVYFSQNQSFFFPSSVIIGDFISEQGDLSYQGVRLAVRLDF